MRLGKTLLKIISLVNTKVNPNPVLDQTWLNDCSALLLLGLHWTVMGIFLSFTLFFFSLSTHAVIEKKPTLFLSCLSRHVGILAVKIVELISKLKSEN